VLVSVLLVKANFTFFNKSGFSLCAKGLVKLIH